MKVFEIRGGFGLDHLQLGERDKPSPGYGQVLVRMRAASVNYRDVLMVTGRYNPRQALPLIPCSDGAGVIEELGEGVSSLAVGDRVATLFAQGWLAGEPTQAKVRNTLGGPLDGTLAEWMVLDQTGVVPVPDCLTDLEVASLPCAALTAWSALSVYGRVKAGDVVLVQGTGGVSLFALQLSIALGASVIVTSSQDAKLERVRDLGSWAEINYIDDADWGDTAKRLTGGRGVDHVIDVGGAETLAQSLQAVKIGGEISMIGILGGAKAELTLTSVLMKNVKIQGILVGSRESFEQMLRVFKHQNIRPLVDRVFPFEESREAFFYMNGGLHLGKICIEF